MPPANSGADDEVVVRSNGFPMDIPGGVVEDMLAARISSQDAMIYVFLMWYAREHDVRTLRQPVEAIAAASVWELRPFNQSVAVLKGIGWLTTPEPRSIRVEFKRGGGL